MLALGTQSHRRPRGCLLRTRIYWGQERSRAVYENPDLFHIRQTYPTDWRTKSSKENKWTVMGEFNYCQIEEDRRKGKNQLGSKLWERQRTAPFRTKWSEREAIGEDQFSIFRSRTWGVRAGKGAEGPWCQPPRWISFELDSCADLGGEAPWSARIEYQEKLQTSEDFKQSNFTSGPAEITSILSVNISWASKSNVPSPALGQEDLVPALKQVSVSDRHVNNWLWYNAKK